MNSDPKALPDSSQISTSPTRAQPAEKRLSNLQLIVVSPNSCARLTRAYVFLLPDAWATAFQDAMYKLSVLGIAAGKVDSLIDCTEILE